MPMLRSFSVVGVASSRHNRLETQQNRRNSQPHWKARKSVLHHRLKELLVFEIHKDGNQQYRNMTLRALYNYVLQVIATKPVDYMGSLGPSSLFENSNISEGTTSRGTRRATVAKHHLSLMVPNSTRLVSELSTDTEAVEIAKTVETSHTREKKVSLVEEDDSSIEDLTPTRPDEAEMLPLKESKSLPAPKLVPLNDDDSSKARKEKQQQQLGPSPILKSRREASVARSGLTFASDYDDNNVDEGRQQVRITGTTSRTQSIRETFLSHQTSGTHLTGVTYRERLGGYLHPRDMRRLVTPFSTSNQPEVIVRRHVILLNFDPLRAIVLRDRLLVLVPDGADSILENLSKRIRSGLKNVENTFFGRPNDSQSNDHEFDEDKLILSAAASTMNNVGDDDDTFGQSAASTANNLSSKNDKENSSAPPLPPPASTPTTKVGNFLTKSILRPAASIILPPTPVASRAMEKRIEARKKIVQKKTSGGLDDDSSSANNRNNALTATQEPDSITQQLLGGPLIDPEDEFDELHKRGWIDLPFELQSVDAVLHVVSLMLTEEANELQDFAYNSIDDLLSQGAVGEGSQEILRSLKGEITEMYGRCNFFIQAINAVLDDDKDLALMNLSRLLTHPERFIQPVSDEILHEESDEPELILEAYLQQSLSNTNALDLLKNELGNTEALMNMKLDAIRNRLLYVNLIVSLVSLTVAIGSFVGSIFGMNLLNGLEDDPNAWNRTVIGTCFCSVVLFVILTNILRRAGLLPKMQ